MFKISSDGAFYFLNSGFISHQTIVRTFQYLNPQSLSSKTLFKTFSLPLAPKNAIYLSFSSPYFFLFFLKNTYNRRKQIVFNLQRVGVESTPSAPDVNWTPEGEIFISNIASTPRKEWHGRLFRNVITFIRMRISTGRGTITKTDLEISRGIFGSEMISFTSKSFPVSFCIVRNKKTFILKGFSVLLWQIDTWPEHDPTHRSRGF